jgi:uncharacterized membrane protein YhdT
MWTLNILFFLATVVTILLSRHEIRRYTDARIAGTVLDADRRRFTRRMVGTGVLTIVLAMTYFGYTNKEAFIGHPWFFALYWLSCIVLALSLIFLAIMDIRAIFRQSVSQYLNEGNEAERLEKFLAKEREKAAQQKE